MKSFFAIILTFAAVNASNMTLKEHFASLPMSRLSNCLCVLLKFEMVENSLMRQFHHIPSCPVVIIEGRKLQNNWMYTQSDITVSTFKNTLLIIEDSKFEFCKLDRHARIINSKIIVLFNKNYHSESVPAVSQTRTIAEKFNMSDILSSSNMGNHFDINWFKEVDMGCKGNSLRVSTFNQPPFVLLNKGRLNLMRHDGIEIRILHEMSRVMNFSYQVKKPTGKNHWSWKLSNGTIFGILGDLIDGRADIGISSLWITSESLGFTDLTSPWTRIGLIFITPRARRVPQWQSLILCLSTSVWIALMVVICFRSVAIYLVAQVSNRLIPQTKCNSYCNFSYCVIDSVQGLAMVSPPSRCQEQPFRHLLWSWLFFCLLITTAYSSTLVQNLTMPHHKKAINTLEDLMDSDLTWGSYGKYILNVFKQLSDHRVKKFIERFHEEKNFSERKMFLNKGNYASVTKVLGKNYVVGASKMSRRERRSLHIMKHNVLSYGIGFGLRPNSPYKEDFDRIIHRLVDCGVVEGIQKTVLREFKFKTWENSAVGPHDREPEKLTSGHLQGVFALLGIGHSMAIVIFVAGKCFPTIR